MFKRHIIGLAAAATLLVLSGLRLGARTSSDFEGYYVCLANRQFEQRLQLLPDGRFAYTWSGCLDGEGVSSGSWKLSDTFITLVFEPTEREATPELRLDVLPAGDSFILVDHSKIEDFRKDAENDYYFFHRVKSFRREDI